METNKRLHPSTFDIPVQEIRRGYRSAVYFWREKNIVEAEKPDTVVLMQVFQKRYAVLCGMDEALAIFQLCSGRYHDKNRANRLFDKFLKAQRESRQFYASRNLEGWERALKKRIELEKEIERLWISSFGALRINALYDGNRIAPWETVMTIDGRAHTFAHLESVYLGILARRTLVATNVAGVVESARGKPVLFFADRFDHYSNQTGDGYAAMISGAYGVATDAMGAWWGNTGMGTIPHALIACFDGDTVAATLAFARHYPNVPCISLVDFRNDCVRTSIEVADALKKKGLKLYGVRLDTSETMVDRSLIDNRQLGEEKPTGVTPKLVENVRKGLDSHGHTDVRVGVSGGFTREKIEYFERVGAPTDFYGCGSSLLKGETDFTADIVQPCAKEGRWFRPNPRLELVGSCDRSKPLP